MTNPTWPQWAHYKTTDEHGLTQFWEKKPHLTILGWYASDGRRQVVPHRPRIESRPDFEMVETPPEFAKAINENLLDLLSSEAEMSHKKLPEGMPPVPEGAVLDGQLKDHVGDAHGYVFIPEYGYWSGPSTWLGMKGENGNTNDWWFARVDPPEVENDRLRHSKEGGE